MALVTGEPRVYRAGWSDLQQTLKSVSLRSGSEELLVDTVRGFGHAQVRVDLLSVCVVFFHVEPQPTDSVVLPGKGRYFTIERTENTLAPEVWNHIDALNPPPQSVPPVAPFVSDHQGADDSIFGLDHQVKTVLRSVEQVRHPGLNGFRIQGMVFRFPGHGNVKVGERCCVFSGCPPNAEWGLCHDGTGWFGRMGVGDTRYINLCYEHWSSVEVMA